MLTIKMVQIQGRHKTISCLAPMFLLACSLVGCGMQEISLPGEYPVSKYKRGQVLPADANAESPFLMEEKDASKQAKYEQDLAKALDERYSPPWAWNVETAGTPEQRSVLAGQAHYHQHCIHCHGVAGAGDGPTSPFLFPRPRDYRRGTFKWKSTARSAKPTKEDIVAILHNGAEGTSMPPFRLLGDNTLSELADYVIYLSKRGELERRILVRAQDEGEFPNAEAINEMAAAVDKTWLDAATAVVQTEKSDSYQESLDPVAMQASINRGRTLYLGEEGGCYKCHGLDGKADPKQVVDQKSLVDDWGNRNYPRNLTLGLFRGGRRPVDLYRRIHEGISGASMPEAKGKIKPEDIWHIVRFLRSLPSSKGLLANAAPTTPPVAVPPPANSPAAPAAGKGN